MTTRLPPGLIVAIIALCGVARASRSSQHLVCPKPSSSSYTKQLQTDDPVKVFNEISGLVFSKNEISPRGNPLLYVITDGKNNYNHSTLGGGRVGAYDSETGERIFSYVLSSHTEANWDYEALALGSCGTGKDFAVEDECIYIGDIGDNVAINTNGKRNNRGLYRIIKFREPSLFQLIEAQHKDNYSIPDQDVWILPFDYSHPSSPTPVADCEAIFLDHTGWGDGAAVGDLYLVPKWSEKRLANNRLFRIPASAWEQTPERLNHGVAFLPKISPKAVGFYPETFDFSKSKWTGADMTWEGTVISLSNVTHTHLFLRCPGESVADSLTGNSTACNVFVHPFPSKHQVETSAWTADGLRYLVIPEGRKGKMGWSHMTYRDANSTTKTCPLLSTLQPSSEPTVPVPEPTLETISPSMDPEPTNEPTDKPSVLAAPSREPTMRISSVLPPSPQPTSSDPTDMPLLTEASLSSSAVAQASFLFMKLFIPLLALAVWKPNLL